MKTTNENQEGGKQFSDPFDLSRIRLSQNYDEKLCVKKLITVVPIKKPSAQDFVRVHPDENWRIQTSVIVLKDERETYLVDPDLWAEIPQELMPMQLVTAINRQKVLFLWPVKLPDSSGRRDNWNRSALDAIDAAKTGWVRVQANMSGGFYEVSAATGPLSEPEWPEISFQEIIRVAFRDHHIQSTDHPVIRSLRGEV